MHTPVSERSRASASGERENGRRASLLALVGRKSSRQRFTALVVVMLAVLSLSMAALISKDHGRTVEEGWRRAESGAASLADNADRAISAARMVTDRAQEAVLRARLSAGLPASGGGLSSLIEYAPQIGSLWAIDKNGIVVASSMNDGSIGYDRSDQSYFRPLLEGKSEFLAPMVWGMIRHIWSWSYTRRIEDENGTFLGVVQAAMRSDDFRRSVEAMAPNAAHRIAVLNSATLAPLALWPTPPAPLQGSAFLPDKECPEAAVMRQLALNLQGDGGRFAVTAADGRHYLVAWKKAGDLIVTAAVSRESALAEFRARIASTLALFVGTVFLIVGLARKVFASMEAVEMALQRATKRERQLSSVLSATSDGVLSIRPDWRINYMNNRAKQILPNGYNMEGLAIWEAFPNSIGSPFWKAEERAMKDRVHASIEAYYLPLGRRYALDAYPGEDGGIIVFFRDVTEARQAQSRIAESERRLGQAQEAGSVAIWEWRVGTPRNFWSEEMYRLLGLPRTVGPSHELFMSRVHPDDRDRVMADLRSASEGASDRFESEFRIPNKETGEERWILSHGEVRVDDTGEGMLMFGVNVDITERRRAELRLAESEAQFRNLMNSAPVTVWVSDEAGNCTFVNQRWFDLTGQDDTASSGTGWVDALHPDDRDRARETVQGAKMRREAFRTEYRIRNAHGDYVWMLDTGEPRYSASGEFLGHIGALTDISDRKDVEEKNQLLAREVDHRAKNALAVVQAIVRLARGDEIAAFRQALIGRVAAMARAHTILARDGWGQAPLHEIINEELAPYRVGGSDSMRVVISGNPVDIAPDAAQPLAMAIHELTTNAAKYGALSAPGGRVIVSWFADQETGGLQLHWIERGGPEIAEGPNRRGFGSSVITKTIERQLNGAVSLNWDREGLRCDISLPGKQVRQLPKAA